MNTQSVEDKQKKRTMRFTSGELDLIKRIFADNENLLKTLRKFFLQMPYSEAEGETLKKTFSSEESFAVLLKIFNPTLDPDAPILQLVDMWLNVEIKEKPTEMAMPFIFARKLMCEYIDDAFNNLKGTSHTFRHDFSKLTEFNVDDDPQQIHSKIIARNALLAHCEAQLNQAVILSNMTEAKAEQVVENRKKDSTQ